MGIDEIKKQSAEYTSENGKTNQSLDKMVRRFETDKRKQSQCQRLTYEVDGEQKHMDLMIARVKARLGNVKEAKQVINARPTELLIKQHLPDPIQQRELELVKKQCEIWTKKTAGDNVDNVTDDGHDCPKLTEIFPF